MFFQLLLASSAIGIASASNWDTYPQVPQTASINGFADPIYSKLPKCAQSCVEFDTDNTPCPYWDTGCLCVMAQWSGEVADCWASSCSGDNLKSATLLALSLCSSVGANQWLMPASVSSELVSAVNNGAKAATTTTSSETGSITSSSNGTTKATSAKESTSETSSASSESASKTSSTNGAALLQYGIVPLLAIQLLSLV